ncbi:MAG: hypothetical protein IPQ05_05505 [Leptospiraceae bacterium]|nr:hypothetical protein [Leptospiraceae bacterium]
MYSFAHSWKGLTFTEDYPQTKKPAPVGVGFSLFTSLCSRQPTEVVEGGAAL